MFLQGNHFSRRPSKGVGDVKVDDAARDGRRDSVKEDRRRRRQKHLEFFGSDGARIGWDCHPTRCHALAILLPQEKRGLSPHDARSEALQLPHHRAFWILSDAKCRLLRPLFRLHPMAIREKF